MAVFPDDEATWNRLDFRALRGSFGFMYWADLPLEHDLAWLRSEGYSVVTFDCAEWADDDAFHEDVAEKLHFPDYYGRNLDAFNDCMSDFAVPTEGGAVLLFRNIDIVIGRVPGLMESVLDILALEVRRNMLHGRRLLVLAQSNVPNLVLAPVGSVSLTWNPQEWFASSRGL